MKIRLGVSFIVGIIAFSFSQRHEIGVFGGIPNIIGDIGKTNYIRVLPSFGADFSIALGINYRYNMNPRQSLRLNFLYSDVSFDDAKALEDYRFNRGLSGKNNFLEGSLTYEYYFFDMNDEHQTAISPYIFGGVSAIQYDAKSYHYAYDLLTNADGSYVDGDPTTSGTDYVLQTTLTTDTKKKTTFGFNFGLGVKYKFNYNWILFAEVAFRPTTQDDLDYSFTPYKDINFSIDDPVLLTDPYYTQVTNQYIEDLSLRQTGNVKTNDWLVVTGFGLAYAFGRPPCYCD